MNKGVPRLNLTDAERTVVAQWLVQNSHNNKLRHGAKKEDALLFHIDVRTVYRIWKAAAVQRALGKPVSLITKKKGCIHQDRKVLDEEKIRGLPFLERTNISQLATNLGVSVGTLHKWKKAKEIKPHTNPIKPSLTVANKLARLKWSLSMLTCISANGKLSFQSMYNIIHIDEKWFNLRRISERYYLLPDEDAPHRTCKSKMHIEKIMFMSVVSRPMYDCNGNLIFDGKLGIFPFIFKEPAARNSKNRQKGTIITKAIQSITKPVMKSCFIQQIVPVIKQKWPEGVSRHIFIQQDNAKPHFNNNDPDFQAVAQSDGFNIQLICQPPNSPDTNVNDLGFFKSIQTLKDRKNARTVDDLIKNVTEAFEEYESYKLNDVYLTLQGCYSEIIKVKGCNNYEIPHIGKGRLRREGALPECVEVEEEIVQDAMEYINQQMNEEEQTEPFSAVRLEDLVNGLNKVNIEEYEQYAHFFGSMFTGTNIKG